MKAGLFGALALLALVLSSLPASAQLSILDEAQDQPQTTAPAEPGPEATISLCGTQPITIARMSWPSAALLAEIHARLLRAQYGCDVVVLPGDLAATGSSMATTGQPAVAPELWVGRIAEVWNQAVRAEIVRPAATSYAETSFEGWFVPDYVAALAPGVTAATLKTVLPTLANGAKVRFISCPIDWGCSLLNRNLIAAHAIADLVDLVEPANRFEMDTLIAEAVGRQEPFILYYWQPNAVLAQFAFTALDLGPYDEEAFQCLARLACASPSPSAFAPETVIVALAEWVFTDVPAIAAYFQRTALPLAAMDQLLAALNQPGASIEGVADTFVATRRDLWGDWIGDTAP